MYDTLSGEQVKAFQWYSFDASDKRIGSAIVGHGENLAYYSSKKTQRRIRKLVYYDFC